jgi:hypothetical protein
MATIEAIHHGMWRGFDVVPGGEVVDEEVILRVGSLGCEGAITTIFTTCFTNLTLGSILLKGYHFCKYSLRRVGYRSYVMVLASAKHK